MINGEIPSAKVGPNTFGSSFMFSIRSFNVVFSPVRNRRIQIAPTAWLSTVARAAPFTPMPNPKMKIGSKMILITAPIMVVSIAIFAKPCVVTNGFIPVTMSTKIVPST